MSVFMAWDVWPWWVAVQRSVSPGLAGYLDEARVFDKEARRECPGCGGVYWVGETLAAFEWDGEVVHLETSCPLCRVSLSGASRVPGGSSGAGA